MPQLRPATDGDSPRIVGIVGACFAQHPGCVFDAAGEMPELLRIAAHYRDLGGEAWVAAEEDSVLACVAWKPSAAGNIELQRLYVDPPAQGKGLGVQLLQHAIGRARQGGARAIELWTDTRFAAAHRLYEKHGFLRGAMTRSLGDKSHSVEFFYLLPLCGDGTE